MDPNACLKRLIVALDTDETGEVEMAAADLADWLLKGGFPPDVMNPAMSPAQVDLFRAISSFARRIQPKLDQRYEAIWE